MTDPGVGGSKGLWGRIKDFFGRGSDEAKRPAAHAASRDPQEASSSSGRRRMPVREVAYWIGNRSPGTGSKPSVYRQVMDGEIQVVRSDGSIYGGGEL